jgi:GAF domain-containing protein
VLEELVYQLGVALEDAQLYRDAQRRAFQEELLGQISTRMRETLDVESVVRTAVQEIRQALDLPEVSIRLSARPDSGASSHER